MDELGKAIEMASAAWREKYADGGRLEDGDSFVAVFRNAYLYVSLQDGVLKTEFIGGQPVVVDMELSVYSEN